MSHVSNAPQAESQLKPASGQISLDSSCRTASVMSPCSGVFQSADSSRLKAGLSVLCKAVRFALEIQFLKLACFSKKPVKSESLYVPQRLAPASRIWNRFGALLGNVQALRSEEIIARAEDSLVV